MTLTVDGKEYTVEYYFTPERGLVNYDGLYVLVDKTDGVWELSGQPASADEKVILESFTRALNDVSQLTVIKE